MWFKFLVVGLFIWNLEVSGGSSNVEVAEVFEITKAFQREIRRFNLRSDYYNKVTKPIYHLFKLLGDIATTNFKPPVRLLNEFKSACYSNNSLDSIAYYLKLMVAGCGDAVIDSKLLSRIYPKLKNPKYVAHHQRQSHVENTTLEWAGIYLWTIYSEMTPMNEFEREKALAKIDQLINSNMLIGEPGLHLIVHELNSIRRPWVHETCLAKKLFVSSEFNYTTLLKYATSIYQDFNSTITLEVICNKIRYPDDEYAAKKQTSSVLYYLKRVPTFLSEWFSQLMSTTWPEIDSVVVLNEIEKQAEQLGSIPRNMDSYNALRARQLVIMPALDRPSEPYHFTYGCKPGTCVHITTHNLHVFMTRTNLEDDDLTGRIDAFNEFVRNNTQNFTNAMPNLWSSIPADVVKSLRTDYGFDVDSMHNNTFYLLYSTHSWLNDTSLEYSSQRYSINGKEMMAKFSYRGSNPWNLLTPRYIERVLILGV